MPTIVAMTPDDLVVTRRGLRFLGRTLPCSVGRTGISTAKREGDAATPAGIHHVTGCLYRPDRMARPNGWALPLRPRDCWSDDSDDADYNNLVRAPHRFGHEMLYRGDRLYDLVLLTDWNWPDATPDAGSAIFIHRWRKPGHPTLGCIAMAPTDLRWIAGLVAPGARLIIR